MVKYYKSKTHNVLESRNAKFNNPNEELIEVPILDPPRSNSIEDDKADKNKNNAPIEGEEEPENENDSHSLISTPDSPSPLPSLDTSLDDNAPSPSPESLPTHQMNTCGK